MDSRELPLLDGPTSGLHDYNTNDMLFDDAIIGHYYLPETSYVQYLPASKLNFEEIISKSSQYSKVTTTDDVLSPSDMDVLPFYFDVVMQLVSLLVSGSVTVLLAWMIIKQQVSNLMKTLVVTDAVVLLHFNVALKSSIMFRNALMPNTITLDSICADPIILVQTWFLCAYVYLVSIGVYPCLVANDGWHPFSSEYIHPTSF